nr:hypothetical protein [Microbacterium bovistercoris]
MTGRARRIRVPGVAADFRVPPGWTTPTDQWIRENAFWRPPAEWTPRDGLPLAPADWVFWLPNTHWYATGTSMYRGVMRWQTSAAWLALASILVTTASAFLSAFPLVRLAGTALGAAMLACLIVYTVLRARTTRRLFRQLESEADRRRSQRLTREYQRYLVTSA